MAFENVATKQASVQRALNLLHQMRQLYAIGVNVQSILTDYQAGTNSTLNAAINAQFTAAERAELAVMLTQISALVTDWGANHSAALGL